jgi:hypothetical protein
MPWKSLVILLAMTALAAAAPSVRVNVSKDTFNYGEDLLITVLNEGPDPVHYSLGPHCGFHVEISVGGQWRRQALCFNCYSEIGSAPCSNRSLAPGSTTESGIPIAAKTLSGGPMAPAGTYRAVFTYFGGLAYSKDFVVIKPSIPMVSSASTTQPVAKPSPVDPELTPEEERRLLHCGGKAGSDPSFGDLRIPTSHMGLPDGEILRGYVESRVMDGTLTEKDKARFWRIVSIKSRVMNPSSRGASQVISGILSALSCFGIDTPPPAGRGPLPDRLSSEPIPLGRKYVSDQGISLYGYHRNQIENPDGFFAPISVSREHDILIVGTRSGIPKGEKYTRGKSIPVIVRLSPSGKLIWEKDLRKKGFMDYEAASLAQAPDGGYLTYILSYVHPGRGATTRIVKLDSQGKILWDKDFGGDGRLNTPFAQDVRLLPQGTLSLKGHVYLKKGVMSAWSAEVDGHGKILSDHRGP